MSRNPKQHLLETARGVFAREGYRGATVSKISEAAGANIAAVNYHFGGKENLFRQVLRHAFDIADAAYPIRGESNGAAATHDRLRTFIAAFLRRTFDPGPPGDFNRIMARTTNDPAAPWQLVIEEVQRLEVDTLGGILGDMGFRGRAREMAVLHVLGLCTFFVRNPMAASHFFPRGTSARQLRPYIDNLCEFVLGGLGAIGGGA